MCEEIEQNDIAPENQNRVQFGKMDKSERIKQSSSLVRCNTHPEKDLRNVLSLSWQGEGRLSAFCQEFFGSSVVPRKHFQEYWKAINHEHGYSQSLR